MAGTTETREEALLKTLAKANELVSKVINGEPMLINAALSVAREIDQLKRNHNIIIASK